MPTRPLGLPAEPPRLEAQRLPGARRCWPADGGGRLSIVAIGVVVVPGLFPRRRQTGLLKCGRQWSVGGCERYAVNDVDDGGTLFPGEVAQCGGQAGRGEEAVFAKRDGSDGDVMRV